MGKLLALVTVAVALWSGWWWLGATGHEKAWDLWLADRQKAGWVAETADLKVAGYPNRIDTTITELQLADPVSGWGWSAPIFQILSLSYKPNHVIAVWPGTQKISTPTSTATVEADTLRGSLVFVPDTDLALDRMQLEISNLVITGPNRTTTLGTANLATRRSAEGTAPEYSHDIAIDVKDLRLADAIKAILDPARLLPANFETARLDMTVAYDAPWDRHAIEGRKPQPTALSIKDLDLTWGPLHLDVRGKLDIDDAGYPVGDLTVKARNWREILDLAVAAGWMPQEMSGNLKSGLQLLATLSGDARSIDIPLSFSNRRTSVGPIAIGPAPKLTTD